MTKIYFILIFTMCFQLFLKAENLPQENTTNHESTISKESFQHKLKKYFTKEYPSKKGELSLLVSFPWVNNFTFQPQNEKRSNYTGFMGISGGLEYCYLPNRSIVAEIGTIINYWFLFPAPSSEAQETNMTSRFVGITHQNQIGRFKLGLGLQFAENEWFYRGPNREYISETEYIPHIFLNKTNIAWGLRMNGHYRIGRNYQVGLTYNPSLFQVRPTQKFNYEHVLSLDFRWNFKLIK